MPNLEHERDPTVVRIPHEHGSEHEGRDDARYIWSGLAESRVVAVQQMLYAIESLGRAAWTVGIVYSEYRRRA